LAGIPSTAPHGLFEPTSRVCNPEASKRSTLGKRRTSPVIRQQGKAACSFRMSERICKQDLSGCSSCCGCDARLRTCERGTQEPFLWLGSIVKKARDDDARGTRRVYIEREREKKDARPAPEINVWHATRTRTSYCCRLRLRELR
jgi:hypothetical protein